MTIDWKALADPFAADEIRWRVGNVAGSGKSCTLLAYLDARAVMDRLDAVVGPARWRDGYRAGADGGLICRIEINVGSSSEVVGGWVGKEDGAENTQIESVKGGLSDAFKRAAVKWGIGRYLYGLDTGWNTIKGGPNEWSNGKGIEVSSKGKHIGWCDYPRLPARALPSGSPRQQKQPEKAPAPAKGKDTPPKTATPPAASSDAEHHASFAADRPGFMVRLEKAVGSAGMYDEVAGMCQKEYSVRPSQMSQANRDKLLTFLETPEGRAKLNAYIDGGAA